MVWHAIFDKSGKVQKVELLVGVLDAKALVWKLQEGRLD